MAQKGYNYTQIINERMEKGVPRARLESDEYSEYSIYIARSHVVDHETKIEARGPCKIGRAKYINNVQRARNQGGSDFRIYARIHVQENQNTLEIERYIANKYNYKKITNHLNQKELYDFSDQEIKEIYQVITTQFKDVIKESRLYI